MEYTFYSFQEAYTGTGATLRDAILDAVSQMADRELTSLAHGKNWCKQYITQEVDRRKGAIFSKVSNFDPVELTEMMLEARDYRISGSTTPARYPLANAIAQLRGTALVTVLAGWSDGLSLAFSNIASLMSKQEQAVTAIDNAGSMAELGNVMSAILEALY